MDVLFRTLARLIGFLGPAAGATRSLDPTGTAAECVAAYRRAVAQLLLSEDQERDARPAFVAELVRRLPQIVTAVTVTCLLPLIVERARARFRAAGESPESAEELSQEVSVKLLRALYGNWPSGNVGAFVSTVCDRTRCDRTRRRKREEQLLAGIKSACAALGFGR